MAWIWIALLLVSTAGAGLADTITCYNCNGTVEQAGTAGTACGWYKGWTSSNLDKRTGVICPDGICYTLMIGGTGQVATIYRGCGQVTCDKLPRGWEKQEAVCDSATNKVKPPPANEKLNDIRLFQASLPGNVSVTNLQYCDTDWCGTGGEQIVQRYTTALAAAAAPPATPAPPPPPAVVPVVVPPPTNVVTTNNVAGTGDQAGTSNQPANGAVVVPVITNGGGQTPAPVDTSKVAAGNAVSAGAVSTGTDNNQPAAGGVVIRPGTMLNSCLQCRSQANDICGLRGSDLLGSVRTVNCNAGFCFIFVRAEAGQPAGHGDARLWPAAVFVDPGRQR
ncbi:uncharacterized protein LOC129592503 [Paramacrobiotus metropolitanus]|uniref:uncharacterized protein LOC129592503 n=1 Tax=Paramacrobiotus metropolitanus TaxID=2943436 RepID=UPI00244587EC|nr:uncharacterized protein LOC129592503 [Paramacrobiotus metropolitanus]